MNTSDWQRVTEIFGAACALPPDLRRQFLDEACEDNDAIRSEVESLLDSFQDAAGFMDSPAVNEVAGEIVRQGEKLADGQMLLHYSILRAIGSGGMGEVYLAQDTKLARKVAIKVLPSASAGSKEANLRLLHEAQSAARLDHPNICTIHEIAEDEGRKFIVMQYIEGEDLAHKIKSRSLDLKNNIRIAIQIAEALAEAHANNIIHRDIKPANIIIAGKGQVKVLDFGLAKIVFQDDMVGARSAASHFLSTAGGIMGTVPYMSPEQVRGEKLDARTDIFSFGAMFYEMLSGTQPFNRASNAEIISAILNDEPPTAAFPEGLQQILQKCLAKDRTERYQNAHDLLDDLGPLEKQIANETGPWVNVEADPNNRVELSPDTNDQVTETQILEPQAQTTHTPKRRRAWQIMAVVFGVVAVASLGLWYFFLRQAPLSINILKVTQITDWNGLDDFPSISPDGNSVAYCSDHSGSFEIYVRSLTSGSREVQLTNDGKQNFQPAFSPDGQRIAYHSKESGGIWIIPATGGEAKQLTNFGTHPAFSPDGKQIAFQSYPLADLGAGARVALPPSTIWVVATDGGEAKQLTREGNPKGGHGAPSWSPDGKRIAIEVDDYNYTSAWTISSDGGDPKPITKDTFGYSPVFSPDGKSVIFIMGSARQIRIDPATGETIGEAVAVGGNIALPTDIRTISFSKDGKRMAYDPLVRRESIHSLPLRKDTSEAGGTPSAIVEKVSGRIHQPAFSPDGKRFAFTSCLRGGASCDIWLANADGSDQTQLTTAESNENMPAWLPGAGEIAFTTDRTKPRSLWAIDLKTRRERELLELKNDIAYYKLSPDGKKMVFNFEQDGQPINIWTASLDGGEPKQLTFDKELAGFPSWSPDGKWIAFQTKRGDDTHITVIPGDGGTREQLTFDKGQSWAYSWSPDSDKILFSGFRNGLWNVWWVSRTTRKEQQLTDYRKLNSFVRYPTWSPSGEQIVYEYAETMGNIWVADLK